MTPVTEEWAGAVAAEYYGVTAPARALPGEFDRNFEFIPTRGPGSILKVSHPDTPNHQLDFENSLMAHLSGLPVPQILPNRNGEMITRLPSGLRARMLSRIRGARLVDVSPRPVALLAEFGALLGRLDRALESFRHSAMHREWLWDLTRAAGIIRPRLPDVPAQDRAFVSAALERFERRVAPALPHLPAQVIHNDANDYNVLVVPDGARWNITGLVDFGDSLHAPRICEPAIAAAYALFGEPDPLSVARRILTGYHRANALSDAELAVYWDLIVTRLAVSMAVAAGRAASDSGNAYHQVSAQPAAQALARLIRMDPDAAREAISAALA